MNAKEYIWNFLADLEKNNSKEWMDANRARYHQAKDYWLEEIEAVLERLASHDPYFEQIEARKTIMRINNNRMFHPDRPIYKTNFACSPSGKTDQISKIFFAFGPGFNFVGGGIYRPDNAALKSIRDAIDYDGGELVDIIQAAEVQRLFGGLDHDDTQLKTSPKGYDRDHKYIDLLRRKSFTASYTPTKKQMIDRDLPDLVAEAYIALTPLVRWIEKATSV